MRSWVFLKLFFAFKRAITSFLEDKVTFSGAGLLGLKTFMHSISTLGAIPFLVLGNFLYRHLGIFQNSWFGLFHAHLFYLFLQHLYNVLKRFYCFHQMSAIDIFIDAFRAFPFTAVHCCWQGIELDSWYNIYTFDVEKVATKRTFKARRSLSQSSITRFTFFAGIFGV